MGENAKGDMRGIIICMVGEKEGEDGGL